MEKKQELEKAFWKSVKESNIPVTISLISGFQFRGIVSEFDDSAIMLDAEGKTCMIYKQAISSVTPGKKIEL